MHYTRVAFLSNHRPTCFNPITTNNVSSNNNSLSFFAPSRCSDVAQRESIMKMYSLKAPMPHFLSKFYDYHTLFSPTYGKNRVQKKSVHPHNEIWTVKKNGGLTCGGPGVPSFMPPHFKNDKEQTLQTAFGGSVVWSVSSECQHAAFRRLRTTTRKK